MKKIFNIIKKTICHLIIWSSVIGFIYCFFAAVYFQIIKIFADNADQAYTYMAKAEGFGLTGAVLFIVAGIFLYLVELIKD